VELPRRLDEIISALYQGAHPAPETELETKGDEAPAAASLAGEGS
jgi:hypothetical protein